MLDGDDLFNLTVEDVSNANFIKTTVNYETVTLTDAPLFTEFQLQFVWSGY